jgi:ABC-type Zn uptake system ZnuABC Zn-binding protein ZnuA
MARALLLLLPLLAGCGRPAPAPAGRPKVVATLSALGEFAREVGGDAVEVVTLVGPDGDAHTFDPTPRDVATLADAVLVAEVGAGFETWLDKLAAASGTQARRAVATAGLTLIEGRCDHSPREKAAAGHTHEDDPHVRHEVSNAAHMVWVVRDGLCAAVPAHADAFRANADRYTARLQELDAWVVEQVKAVPRDRRKLVTNHDTFGYFADRHGFTVAGAVLPWVSTEAADPSAADFAKPVAAVTAHKVPAVFCEASHNARLVERLAAEAGVTLAPPLSTDALGPPGRPGATYEGMVRHNVATIVAALR